MCCNWTLNLFTHTVLSVFVYFFVFMKMKERAALLRLFVLT